MPRLQFGPFELNPDTRVLRRQGVRVPLSAQPARALTTLVERAGATVSREDLRTALWGDRAVEAETGLNFCMHQVRTALGDDAKRPAYIETVPGLGYRFIARVTTPRPRWISILLTALAAALVAVLLVPDDTVVRPAIDGLDLEIVRADSVPDAVLREVSTALDSVLMPWRREDGTASHRVLLSALWSDSLDGVEWQFRLVEAGDDEVLVQGTMRAGGKETGAQAPYVAEGMRSVITSWLAREAPSGRRARRAEAVGAPH